MNKKTILSLIFGLPLISCSIFSNSNYGLMRTSVKFPDRSFNIKLIPDNTNTILVKVSGEGLNEPILFELSKTNNSKLLKNVPEGNKNINASAIDIDGNIIAKGDNHINLIAQQLNTVEVELKLNDKLNPSPSPTPSLEPVNCQIELEKKDLPLSENLVKAIEEAGCKIIEKATPTSSPIPSLEPSSDISSSPSSNTNNTNVFENSGSSGSNTNPSPSQSASASPSSSPSSNNIQANINIIDGVQKNIPDIILKNNIL